MRFFLAFWAILANLWALDSGDLARIFGRILRESARNNSPILARIAPNAPLRAFIFVASPAFYRLLALSHRHFLPH